ncbi:OsmC family protein [Nocardioides sp. NPDC087217]|uniref:OsmC family protein n=1 Tax=Nocardioides sp. NPDC087217 TaxID=3364335 RepID=UPI003830B112
MALIHDYKVSVEWTGNRGTGTSGYRDYARDHVVRIEGLPDILGSADPTFRGDASRHNPEQLLLTSLAQCHMLSYLHQAVTVGVVVLDYHDAATATMETQGTGGRFTRAVLHPVVTVAEAGMIEAATSAHHQAHLDCFIASSVNFPVDVEPTVIVGGLTA